MKFKLTSYLGSLFCLGTFFLVSSVKADGVVIDKVYHPYVDALEKEIEYRFILQDEQTNLKTHAQIHRLSLGNSFSDRWFGEIYLIGSKSRTGNFNLEAYEIEVKWQLSEQGEFWADWGLLFEYEKERKQDIQEVSFGILSEKEWGRWSATVNLHLTKEWGDVTNDEFETKLALQSRYRYSQAFEPGIEFYAGQKTIGMGPIIQGNINVGVRRNLHWESGLILGLNKDSPDQTVRFLLEYEF